MLRLDVRERDSDFEISVFRDGRAIIKGTDDPKVARKLYAKFIGT
jgi:adenylyltransferase/sulfurtransferase